MKPSRVTANDLKYLRKLAAPYAGAWEVTNSTFVGCRVPVAVAARLKALGLVSYWTEYPRYKGGKYTSFVKINDAGRVVVDGADGPWAGGFAEANPGSIPLPVI